MLISSTVSEVFYFLIYHLSVFTGDNEDMPTCEYKFYFKGHLDNVVNLRIYNNYYIP